jgi:hypothetical protein
MLLCRHPYRGLGAQPLGSPGEAAIVKSEKLDTLTAGQHVQCIGEIESLTMLGNSIEHARPLLDNHIRQA